MISIKMKYALKAIAYIARYSPKENCLSTMDIAQEEDYSIPFLRLS
jgi:DNA-binding IscR family transcriptional regulator